MASDDRERAAPAVEAGEAPGQVRDPRRVMVIHGRHEAARRAMFSFLRGLGLNPVEWDEAVEETGVGTPHNLEAVRAALARAQAVVALFTPDEEARLRPELEKDADASVQPRPNVLFETGLAFAAHPARTIIVEIGRNTVASDLAGLNTIRFDGRERARDSLRKRLVTAGCEVNPGPHWRDDGDFEAALAILP